jgi:outer membrane receptor for ferrienterochelin and colicin
MAIQQLLTQKRLKPIPSVTRDIKDILRLNPFVALDDEEDGEESISIGGAHPRSNDIRVDGVSFNDDFGLNDNGYPSQRSPY